MITIDKNIPVPKKERFPFSEMEIGDSFFVSQEEIIPKLLSAYAVQYSNKNNKKVKFKTKKEVLGGIKGTRIWRII